MKIPDLLTHNRTSRFSVPLLLAMLLLSTLTSCTYSDDSIVLERDNLRIVFADGESGPLKIALEAFT